MILDELNEIRDELWEDLPTGSISSDGFNLIKSVKKHIENLDKIVEYYQKVQTDSILKKYT